MYIIIIIVSATIFIIFIIIIPLWVWHIYSHGDVGELESFYYGINTISAYASTRPNLPSSLSQFAVGDNMS